VPFPPAILDAWGLRVLSDSVAAANPVVRTIVLGLNPAVSGVAVATLLTNDSGSPLGSVDVTLAGVGYVLPPVVTFTGGRPAPVVQPGYPTITFPDNQPAGSLDSQPMAQATLTIVGAAASAGGAGYSAATSLVVSGAIQEGGTPAVLTPTVTLGVLTGVTIVDPGAGYVGVPPVTVVDPAATPGTGARVTVSMGLGAIELLRAGAGYIAPPTVVLTPAFQALFPPAGAQGAPLAQLMTTALGESILSPVTASPP